MKGEFKPCPFCGKKPLLQRRSIGHNQDYHVEEWEIECPYCGARPSSKRYISEFYITLNDEVVYKRNGRKEAIEVWQRRYEQQHCGTEASVVIVDECCKGEADVKGGCNE